MAMSMGQDHICTDHGYVYVPPETTDTTAAPNGTDVDPDSNCAAFSLAVVLFLREFF